MVATKAPPSDGFAPPPAPPPPTLLMLPPVAPPEPPLSIEPPLPPDEPPAPLDPLVPVSPPGPAVLESPHAATSKDQTSRKPAHTVVSHGTNRNRHGAGPRNRGACTSMCAPLPYESTWARSMRSRRNWRRSPESRSTASIRVSCRSIATDSMRTWRVVWMKLPST